MAENLYERSARPIVQAVMEGFNGTIFAYGQTGTGKTFTMEGERKVPHLRGIIPRSFDHIFGEIDAAEGKQFLVRASYMEIYMEDIRDLLSKDSSRKLKLRNHPDSGVYVEVRELGFERYSDVKPGCPAKCVECDAYPAQTAVWLGPDIVCRQERE